MVSLFDFRRAKLSYAEILLKGGKQAVLIFFSILNILSFERKFCLKQKSLYWNKGF